MARTVNRVGAICPLTFKTVAFWKKGASQKGWGQRPLTEIQVFLLREDSIHGPWLLPREMGLAYVLSYVKVDSACGYRAEPRPRAILGPIDKSTENTKGADK